MQDKQFGLDTLAVHAGQRPDPVTGSRAVPIGRDRLGHSILSKAFGAPYQG